MKGHTIKSLGRSILSIFFILYLCIFSNPMTNQQNALSIHLWSGNAFIVPYLAISSTQDIQTNLWFDWRFAKTDIGTNQLTYCWLFCSPTLCHNSSSCFKILGTLIDDHYLQIFDGTTEMSMGSWVTDSVQSSTFLYFKTFLQNRDKNTLILLQKGPRPTINLRKHHWKYCETTIHHSSITLLRKPPPSSLTLLFVYKRFQPKHPHRRGSLAHLKP